MPFNSSQRLQEVREQAQQILEWVTPQNWLLDIALDNLTLSRTRLYQAILSEELSHVDLSEYNYSALSNYLKSGVDSLRQSGRIDCLPMGLLTQAWPQSLRGDSEGAKISIDESWEIAERGPMPLYQADILLTRVRLFAYHQQKTAYPWDTTAEEDLKQARHLIETHGYHRRDQELRDVEAWYSEK